MPRTVPSPPPIPNLATVLTTQTVDKLKWYAAGLPGHIPTRKPELVDHIASTLTDARVVKLIYSQLTENQQNALAEIIHRYNGKYEELPITARYPGTRLANTNADRYSYSFGYSSRKQSDAPTNFELFFFYQYSYSQNWFIPADLLEVVREIAAPPQPMKITGKQAIPILEYRDRATGVKRGIEQFESRAEATIFTDLAATLAFIADGKVTVGVNTHLPTLPTVRTLKGKLLVPDLFLDADYNRAEDAMRTQALIVIVQAAHWAAAAGSSSKLQLTRAGSEVLARGISAPHIREAWAKWLKSNLLDELSRITNIKGQQANATRLNKPALRHEAIDKALRALPLDKWVTIDEFTRYIRGENLLPDIEISHPTGLYVGSSYYGGLYSSREYWDVVIGSYVRAVIMEYVATLGIVEIAYTKPEYKTRNFDNAVELNYLEADYLSRYDGLIALKLTSLGAYALGIAGSYDPGTALKQPESKTQGGPVLRVLPTLDIVILDASRLMPHHKMLLERIGTAQSDHVYRLNRDVILESVGKVIKLDQVKLFLAEKSGITPDALPNTVLTFFDDVHKRSTTLREGDRLLVFESDDPYLLTELSAAPGLKGIAQLGKIGTQNVLFIPESHEKEVRKQIKKLGYAALKKISQ